MSNAQVEEALALIGETLQSKADVTARNVARRIAGRVAGKVRDYVIRQLGEKDWPPLSPGYAEWKRRKNLDPRMLRATGEYINSIVPRLDEDNKQFVVSPADRPHKDPVYGGKEDNLQDIGVWLEYGTLNADGSLKMPARPHWRPVLQEVEANLDQYRAEFSAEYWSEIVPLLVDKLRSMGFEVATP